MTTTTVETRRGAGMTAEERKVIFASSLGTVFEWYDFYIYGTLGAFLAKYFFSNVPANVGFIFALLAFAAGFAVRPFGALFFGRLGDMIGRKYTFLDDHDADGRRHVPHRRAARLSRRWGIARADRADRAAPGARPRARRRIWRRGDLRRRACAPGQARLLHLVDPDHRHARPVPGAVADPRHPHRHGRSRPSATGAGAFRSCSRPSLLVCLDLDPAQAATKSPLFKQDGGGRQAVEGAARRKPSASGRMPRSRSPRCSAPPPARPWCGTADSSTRCSS